ncbi:hypothetical protein MANES_05G078350v8 [Manihot esculenta]|uniref:Uncharacterized protein n=1 Tax=Manihot esculenta TaxID=3983 RepID=A0ACB7HP06_MANES|nr:hypothetical protein MANES_05G078350v8 [Manihot esculenta]
MHYITLLSVFAHCHAVHLVEIVQCAACELLLIAYAETAAAGGRIVRNFNSGIMLKFSNCRPNILRGN